MTTEPRKCAKCREKAVSVVTEDYRETVEHDGKSYDLVVPSLEVSVCGGCGNRVLGRDANKRISDALRVKAGLLFPAQIQQERLRLRFTQEDFADLLRIGKATLSRWENDAQVQSLHMDAMLRAFFACEAFRRQLENQLRERTGAPALPGPARSSATNATVTASSVSARFAFTPVADGAQAADGEKVRMEAR